MKPRIRLIDGLWHCIGNGVWGMGYEPGQAYDEWAELHAKLRRGRLYAVHP